MEFRPFALPHGRLGAGLAVTLNRGQEAVVADDELEPGARIVKRLQILFEPGLRLRVDRIEVVQPGS